MMKKSGKYGYPINFFHANVVIRVLVGLWRPGNDVSLYIRIPYYVYVFSLYSVGFIFIVCEGMIFKQMLKDIPKLLSYIGMCLTHLLGVLKLGIFIFGKNIDGIMNSLQDDRFKYVSLGDYGPAAMLKSEQAVSSSIAYGTFVMYFFVGGSAHISALINIFKEIPGDTFEGTNKTCYDFMPYFFHIPFSADTKWKCILASTFMDCGFAMWAINIAYYDGVFVSLLKCFKIQLIIAAHVLVTIRERCSSENIEVIHDEDYPQLEQAMHKQLKQVIEHLSSLLEIRDDIESFTTFISLAQTLCSIFIFASCLYVASTVEMMSPVFFAQIQFFCSVLIQLTLICWSANEITIAGQNISSAMYESDWFSCSKRFKVSMILTMIRMQRPIILTIGKFTPLTITTLVNVCRGSFSYFAVFKTVK